MTTEIELSYRTWISLCGIAFMLWLPLVVAASSLEEIYKQLANGRKEKAD